MQSLGLEAACCDPPDQLGLWLNWTLWLQHSWQAVVQSLLKSWEWRGLCGNPLIPVSVARISCPYTRFFDLKPYQNHRVWKIEGFFFCPSTGKQSIKGSYHISKPLIILCAFFWTLPNFSTYLIKYNEQTQWADKVVWALQTLTTGYLLFPLPNINAPLTQLKICFTSTESQVHSCFLVHNRVPLECVCF